MKEGLNLKTIAINQFGTADEFHEINLDQPAFTADTVAVAIHAFSINPMDIAARAGYLQSPFSDNWSFPLVLGWDFSGIITEVGQNVTQYHAGDHVFGTLASDHPGNAGSYAEATVVDPAAITKIPTGMSFDQAAALPIAAGTAYQAIVQNLKVQSNDTVLVQGGAGGVGLFAVQIAKALGAKVITTASPAHTELLQKLGIDQIIDYHTTAVADVVSTVDAVFDTAGDIAGGLGVLKSGGKLVTVAGQPTPEQLALPDKSVSFQFSHTDTAVMTGLSDLFTKGQLNIELQTLPFTAASVIKAHQTIEGHHTTGKLVIHVAD